MKKRVNRFTRIVVTTVLLFTVVLMSNCGTLSSVVQEPVISLHSAELVNISIDGVRILCRIQVQNPNSFEIPFPETDWALFINANSFVNGTVKNDQRIRARGSAIIDVPVNLSYTGVFNSFRSLMGSRQVNYKVALGIKIPTPVFGDRVWNIEHEGALPLPQAPRLTTPSIRLGNVDTTRAEVLVTLNFENPNAFAVPAPRITYDYTINRNSFIRGTVDNEGPLAAQSTTPVNIRLQVTYTDLFRSFAALVTAREVTTSFNFSCDFGLPQFGWSTISNALPLTLPIRR